MNNILPSIRSIHKKWKEEIKEDFNNFKPQLYKSEEPDMLIRLKYRSKISLILSNNNYYWKYQCRMDI